MSSLTFDKLDKVWHMFWIKFWNSVGGLYRLWSVRIRWIVSILSGQLKHVGGWLRLKDIGVLQMVFLAEVDWLVAVSRGQLVIAGTLFVARSILSILF